MACDFLNLPHPGIQSVSPYIPGKSIGALEREQGITNIIKLASNENPRGCSPFVLDALAKLSPQQIATYPAPTTELLPSALTSHLNIQDNMLTLSNGSDALFQLLMICFALHTDKHIISHQYAFQTFGILANVLGIPMTTTPLLPNWDVDIQAMIDACNDKTALIFIANPNNPTGTYLSQSSIEHLLAHIPETTLLVLDEAYHEFIAPDLQFNSIALIERYPNLVITRTFSKAYGLASLRLGYAISNPQIQTLLARIVLPFTLNLAALTAGLAALNDQEFLQQTIQLNAQELHRVREALIDSGFECLPSHGNFVTFHCHTDGKIAYEQLLHQGIIVRPLHPYGLDPYLRVSIGTTEQNTRFLNALTHLEDLK